MSLQGEIRQFDLFGEISPLNLQGSLSLQVQFQSDLKPVLLKGTAGVGAKALKTLASSDFILASNNTILTSHE